MTLLLHIFTFYVYGNRRCTLIKQSLRNKTHYQQSVSDEIGINGIEMEQPSFFTILNILKLDFSNLHIEVCDRIFVPFPFVVSRHLDKKPSKK